MSLGKNARGLATLTLLVTLLVTLTAPGMAQMLAAAQAKPKPLMMAHYMPWFQAPPTSVQYGWHWTMNRYHPEALVNGQAEIASHYAPLIGPYDSGDPDALRCQVMLMKLAGIDGVVVDWYGPDEFADYGANNRNTEKLLRIVQEAGLKFAVCYEDQTVPKEISGGVFPALDAVGHGQRVMQWIQAHFFSSPAYLKQGGRPVFFTFGDSYYMDDQWNRIFSVLPQKPLYFTESTRQAPTASVGAFDWPQPGGGTTGAMQEQDRFLQNAPSWPLFVPAAYPRFDDIYQQAGVQKSYGHIDDRDGQTYTDTLTKALRSGSWVVQIVTWNDWGEGTQIEPSVQYGTRDLAATQRLRRQYVDPNFARNTGDLTLPIKWYKLRKKYAGNADVSARLAAFFPLVVEGHLSQARALLAKR